MCNGGHPRSGSEEAAALGMAERAPKLLALKLQCGFKPGWVTAFALKLCSIGRWGPCSLKLQWGTLLGCDGRPCSEAMGCNGGAPFGFWVLKLCNMGPALMGPALMGAGRRSFGSSWPSPSSTSTSRTHVRRRVVAPHCLPIGSMLTPHPAQRETFPLSRVAALRSVAHSHSDMLCTSTSRTRVRPVVAPLRPVANGPACCNTLTPPGPKYFEPGGPHCVP